MLTIPHHDLLPAQRDVLLRVRRGESLFEAAVAAGVSCAVAERWMKDGAFADAIEAVHAEVIENIHLRLNAEPARALGEALWMLMTDPDARPHARLQAAQLVLQSLTDPR
jgi:hypothetical protein